MQKQKDAFYRVPEDTIKTSGWFAMETKKICGLKFKPNIQWKSNNQQTTTRRKEHHERPGKQKQNAYHWIQRSMGCFQTRPKPIMRYLPRWIVKYTDGSEEVMREEDIKEKFNATYLESVKVRCDGMTTKGIKVKQKDFVFLPIGAIMKKPPLSATLEAILEERQQQEPVPQLQYTQQNEDKCLYASCASALHYCGLTEMAKDVFDLFDKRKQELANDNTLIRTKLVDDIDAIRSIFTNKESKYNKMYTNNDESKQQDSIC